MAYGGGETSEEHYDGGEERERESVDPVYFSLSFLDFFSLSFSCLEDTISLDGADTEPDLPFLVLVLLGGVAIAVVVDEVSSEVVGEFIA